MFKASIDPGGPRCCSSLELLYLPMSLSEDMGTSSTNPNPNPIPLTLALALTLNLVLTLTIMECEVVGSNPP